MKNQTKKRQLLAFSLILALAAAVAVNWYYSKAVPETTLPEAGTEAVSMLGDTVLVAGTARDTQTQDADVESEDAAARQDAAFSELELQQTQNRDRLEEKLDAVLKTEALDEEGKGQVTELLRRLQRTQEAQTNCETLIRAKVGGRAIVLLEEDGAQVVVERGKLNDRTALQITEILEQNAHIPAENLTILEVNS